MTGRMGRRVTVRRDDLQVLLRSSGYGVPVSARRLSRLRESASGPSVFVGVYADALEERQRAHAKHGPNSMEVMPWDDLRRLPILTEEVGEVARAICEGLPAGQVIDQDNLHEELIQVAAMALAWADAVQAAKELKAGVGQ